MSRPYRRTALSPLLYSATTSNLVPPSPKERRRALTLPRTDSTYHGLMECHRELFGSIEHQAAPEVGRPASGTATIAFWNVERGKFPAESAALLGSLGADALLICELDIGMARSNQRHTVRDLAERIGCGYAFAVEFIELGLGDRAEQVQHQGAVNEAGFMALRSCRSMTSSSRRLSAWRTTGLGSMAAVASAGSAAGSLCWRRCR